MDLNSAQSIHPFGIQENFNFAQGVLELASIAVNSADASLNLCYSKINGGGGGIRTPETLSGLTVFKTAGFNRSPTPPFLIVAYSAS